MHGERSHYVHLGIMTALSFVAMFVLMYAMVDQLGNVYLNLNQAYMAGLMAAPMALIELGVMRGMYTNPKANLAFGAVAVVALIGFFVLIRRQTAIGDIQFLKSMIPHHASAILMCGKTPVTDPEIKRLCEIIIRGQQQEIDQMKTMLARMEK